MNNYSRGEKRVCSSCGTKFFDLNRTKLNCPNCNTEIIIENLSKKEIKLKQKSSEKATKEVKENLNEKDLESFEDNIDDEYKSENEIDEEDSNSTVVDID